MRPLVLGVLVAATTVAGAAPKASNPAFLGVGMHDAAMQQQSVGPCVVDSVTPGAGAKAAGLEPGDVFRTIDGHAVDNCDAVLASVISHQPGAWVTVDIVRYGEPLVIKAELLSRDEVLHRRFVGKPIPQTGLVAVESARPIDLTEMHGKTMVLGWFDSGSCSDCGAVFAKVATWAHANGNELTILAISPPGGRRGPVEGLDQLKRFATSLEVPLAMAGEADFDQFALSDHERINFMVVDGRGVVQYVGPVAPNAEDSGAALDELFAAAGQAQSRGRH